MKKKVSLTLSEDLVKLLDRLSGPHLSRSAFVEKILRDVLDGRAQAQRLAREVAAINRHAAKLNAEMSDALTFQASAAGE